MLIYILFRIVTYLGNERRLADLVRGEEEEGEGAVAAGDAVVEGGKGESGEESGGEKGKIRAVVTRQ